MVKQISVKGEAGLYPPNRLLKNSSIDFQIDGWLTGCGVGVAVAGADVNVTDGMGETVAVAVASGVEVIVGVGNASR